MERTTFRRGAALATLAAGATLACAPSALATVADQNGAPALERNGDTATAPDGTGERQLTSGPAADRSPEWALDGRSMLLERPLATDVPLQAFANTATRWLEHRTGLHVDRRIWPRVSVAYIDIYVPLAEAVVGTAGGLANERSGRVVYGAEHYPGLRRAELSRRAHHGVKPIPGSMPKPTHPADLAVVLHESLHLMCPIMRQEDEEHGLLDAVAADLVAPFSKWLDGRAQPAIPAPDYESAYHYRTRSARAVETHLRRRVGWAHPLAKQVRLDWFREKCS